MARFEQRAFQVFNRLFEEQLPDNNFNHAKTFEKVSDEIEERAEFRVYSDYNSFKNARSRNRKTSREKIGLGGKPSRLNRRKAI